MTNNSSTPLWQQGIILLFAAAAAFLVVWLTIHGITLPDWLAAFLGVFTGFIAHALASTSAVNASEKVLSAAREPQMTADTPVIVQGSPAPRERVVEGSTEAHTNVGG